MLWSLRSLELWSEFWITKSWMLHCGPVSGLETSVGYVAIAIEINRGYRSICLKASCAPLFAKTARGPHSKPERCSRLSLWNGFLPPAKQAILNKIQLWPSQSPVFCTPSPTTSSCYTTAVLKCLVLAPGRFSQPPISFFMAATVILALLTMLTAVLACYMWFNWVPAFSLKAPEHWP